MALLLMLAGTERLLSFVLHKPLLAYANSYDMIRLRLAIRSGRLTLQSHSIAAHPKPLSVSIPVIATSTQHASTAVRFCSQQRERCWLKPGSLSKQTA
ncbi:MAG: hypothetical protein R3E67_00325 [Pseudomonadales bacterium]